MNIESSEAISRREALRLGVGGLALLTGILSGTDAYLKLAQWRLDQKSGCMASSVDHEQACLTPLAREKLWGEDNQAIRLNPETDQTWLNLQLGRFLVSYELIRYGWKQAEHAVRILYQNSEIE